MNKLSLCSFFIFTTAITFTTFCAKVVGEAPLTDPLIGTIDGKEGLMDGEKIKNTLWMLQEIKKIHNGIIMVNSKDVPDTSRGSVQKQLTFKGKNQDIKSLIDLETRASQLSAQDKAEFDHVFKQLKDYFELVNEIMLADARGTFDFMNSLINEFCGKHNRNDSLLRNWKKGKEAEMYRTQVTNVKIFYRFTLDLMLFLADLVVSFPLAKAQYEAQKARHAGA